MISIVVAVYNIEDKVKYCIESILHQTNPNWELILVNDGSKDHSESVCKEYALNNPSIRVVTKSNGGLSSARNAGISEATGEWIMFVDGDDYLRQDAIHALTEMSERVGDNTECIQYGYIETKDYLPIDNTHKTNLKLEEIASPKEMFERLLSIGGEAASACTKLIRRRVMDKLKFKEGIINEDEEFTSRLLLTISGMAYTNFKPYMYVRRSDSITTSRFSKKRLDIISIMLDRIEMLRNRGYDDIAHKFREKLIGNLDLMFLAASAAGDSESCSIIKQELIDQLQLVNYAEAKWPRLVRCKYKSIAHKFPTLELEAALRHLLNKQVRYE